MTALNTRLAALAARFRHGTFSSLYVRNYRLYHKRPYAVEPEDLDFAVENYFSASSFPAA